MTRVSTILLFTVLLACIVAMGLAGTVQKRDIKEDLEDLKDNFEAELPQGNACLLDENCSSVEYCDRSEITDPHCRMHLWFIASAVGAVLALIFLTGVSCLCCPCCCLYSMCRKT